MLYQMLTGQKPFVEDDSFTVMQNIRLDRYVSPRKLNPQVPRQLEHIMARCMEKMPANRYGSAVYSTAQLKTIQEVITLLVFAGFSVVYLKESFGWNHLVGFALISAGAFFIFHKW